MPPGGIPSYTTNTVSMLRPVRVRIFLIEKKLPFHHPYIYRQQATGNLLQ